MLNIHKNDGRAVDAAGVKRATLAFELLLQGKWKLQILSVMGSGPVRLGQLARFIPGASKKVLTQNLRKLEADGIVVRTDLSDVILHVEYDLNPDLRDSVSNLLSQLGEWGDYYSRWSTSNTKAVTQRGETADISVTTSRRSTKSSEQSELKVPVDRLSVVLSDVDKEEIVSEFRQMRGAKRTSARRDEFVGKAGAN